MPAGDLERLEKAISRGDDVNYLTAGDWNAGMAAAIEGHTGALKMVIDAGVNLEQRSEPNQWNALMFAISGTRRVPQAANRRRRGPEQAVQGLQDSADDDSSDGQNVHV